MQILGISTWNFMIIKSKEYLTDYNHKYIINISPKYYMSLPKAQSLHEHEYAKTIGNGW